MFTCDRCQTTTALREPCNKVVVETRPKIYQSITMVGDENHKVEKIRESKGTEIVKELRLCALCFAKLHE